MSLTLTILGCGSSGGVPRLGNQWGKCDPYNSKNVRMRCSVLLRRVRPEGATNVLVDTSPDMRQQLLNAGCGDLDAVVYTHEHADHTHGIDDLRMIVINRRAVLPVYADGRTQTSIMGRFGYAFYTPEGSPYPPILKMHNIDEDVPLTIEGKGGPITLTPIPVEHGTQGALGFRIGDTAYMPDVSDIPDSSLVHLEGLRLWIVDCLRETPHPSHFNLEASLNWIEKVQPQEAILTNLHVDLDYVDLAARTPEHISPAFDGREVSISA
ncbi:MAG: MBL fold metallo-hydrolase [Pseudomonadota bacterium]